MHWEAGGTFRILAPNKKKPTVEYATSGPEAKAKVEASGFTTAQTLSPEPRLSLSASRTFLTFGPVLAIISVPSSRKIVDRPHTPVFLRLA